MNSATYNIEDFDVVYDSNCIDSNLLFIKMSFEGYLYEYNRINHTKLDSIYINKSEMELLFKYD